MTTIRQDGSRSFLFPADVRGRFARARQISAVVLIAFYLALPWIRIGGHPAVFLDVALRRFHLFGVTLAAQDLWLLFFVISGLGFSLFFVTAMLGRIWCGWACPHTVFLDHVYRRIERWIDGDATRRRALAAAPWTGAKAFKRGLKFSLYVLISAVIAHLLLAYFVSLPELWSMMRTTPGSNWGSFVFMAILTAALTFHFGWFREQLCIVICPYGRLQSAMIDDHSLVVGYDAKRGEPRGRKPQSEIRGQKPETASGAESATLTSDLRPLNSVPGDCIDCLRCVQVCPTGIDIRHGLQMECVGCTACIDACDAVMTRLNRPQGLIRYDSQARFAGGKTRWLRPRIFLYLTLLLAGSGASAWALSTVRPAALDVTRMVGAPYIVDDAFVRNQFLVRVVNKHHAPVRFVVRVEGAPQNLRQVGFETATTVEALGEIVQPLVLLEPRDAYAGPFGFIVRLEDESGGLDLERTVKFLGPDPRLLSESAHPAKERTP